jgi:SAM-dependent methyltransferase
MTWWYAVVNAKHEIQNPTSAEKIRLLGERLGLGPSSRVLDIASGKGGPARILAGEFGCRITCVEQAPEFASVARERAGDLIEVVEADAKDFPIEPGYDAALCLGASFVSGGFFETLTALAPAAPLVAVGEPYWRTWPLPRDFEPDEDEKEWVSLADTVKRAEWAGVRVVSLIDSSPDDWDRYETLQWLALDDWLAANPDDPQAEEFRGRGYRNRERYVRSMRDLLGWAIFVCKT